MKWITVISFKGIMIMGVITLLSIGCNSSSSSGSDSSDDNSDKLITAFSFTAILNTALSSDVSCIVSDTNISCTVPAGTDVTALIASFEHTGQSVLVVTVEQISGETANDFTGAVLYIVTATNESVLQYTVTVTKATAVESDAKEITAFGFTGALNSALSVDITATISGTDISALVPFGTNVTALIANFATTGELAAINGTQQVSGVTANNFSNVVTYVVTAADGSVQNYTVTVTITEGTAGDTVTYTADTVSFTMVYVPGELTFYTGTSDAGTASVPDPYLVSQTEVTYQLWHAVYTWGTSNGYVFANAGREGNDGSDDAKPTAAAQEPVTMISWRDAMVWMNALTEYYNAKNETSLSVVYTYDSSAIRDSSDSNAADCDGAVASSTADGFRLLTSNEWAFAARYINDANDDGDIQDSNEYYPADNASGADAQYWVSTGGSDIDGDGDVEYTADVAGFYDNYATTTRVVKNRSPNALGLYDMSGNVQEWVFDLDGSYRLARNGAFGDSSAFQRVSYVDTGYYPYSKYSVLGFRFARTQ
ncbi:SUMF1/EgtB/PvdO family nonheme iron enzyme [bacterium]|nr:SUMF1/EgtB/PvdO family nonheme iron enzyme [bacterium]